MKAADGSRPLPSRLFVTGTDTNVGKTIVSAWLCQHLQAAYWKPIQTGTEEGTDLQVVSSLLGKSHPHPFFPSTYLFSAPVSPHLAAMQEKKSIEIETLSLPSLADPLIVEGAGGVLVPLTPSHLMIDLMVQYQLPVVVVARSTLGTLNHTLLTLHALKSRGLTVEAIVMNGHSHWDNEQALAWYGGVKVIPFPVLEALEISPQGGERLSRIPL